MSTVPHDPVTFPKPTSEHMKLLEDIVALNLNNLLIPWFAARHVEEQDSVSEAASMSINGRMDRENVFTHNGVLLCCIQR